MFRSKLLIPAVLLLMVFLSGETSRLHAHGGGHGGGGHGGYYGGHHGYGYHGYGYYGYGYHGFGFGYPGFGFGYPGFGFSGFGLYGFGLGGLGYGGLGYGGLGYGGLGIRGLGYGGYGYGGYGYGGYGGFSSGCGCTYLPPISGGPIAPIPAPAPANPGYAPLPVPNRVSSASRYTDYYTRNSNPASSSALAARTADSASPYSDYYAHQAALAISEITNKARLHLHVPADAVVRLNGQHMRTTGAERDYLSPELEAGETYSYHIQVTWTQDEQQREESREVKVRANKSTTVRFGDASLAQR